MAFSLLNALQKNSYYTKNTPHTHNQGRKKGGIRIIEKDVAHIGECPSTFTSLRERDYFSVREGSNYILEGEWNKYMFLWKYLYTSLLQE